MSTRMHLATLVRGSRSAEDEQPADAQKAARQARLREKDLAFFERLRSSGIDPTPKKMTVEAGKRILTVYFATHGHVLDRWGNWRPNKEDASTKYGIEARVVTKEVKGDHGWIKVKSWPIIDLAQAWVAAAAKNVGEAEIAEVAVAKKQERKVEKSDAAEKRLRKLALDVARERIRKRSMAKLRDQGLLPQIARDVRGAQARPQVRAILEENEIDEFPEQMRALQQIRANRGQVPEPDDGALWSLAAPPWPWIDGSYYRWEEDGHTVRLDGRETNTPWVIGRTDAFAGINPLSFRMEMRQRFAGGEGDGWIGGGILYRPEKGEPPLVMITTVGSQETDRKGVGRKLVALAARMARGLGSDRVAVTTITREGASFWNRLEETGELVRLHVAPNGDRLYQLGSIGEPRTQAKSQGKPSLAALLQAAKRK